MESLVEAFRYSGFVSSDFLEEKQLLSYDINSSVFEQRSKDHRLRDAVSVYFHSYQSPRNDGHFKSHSNQSSNNYESNEYNKSNYHEQITVWTDFHLRRRMATSAYAQVYK